MHTPSKKQTGWIATLLAAVAALGIIAVPTSMAYLQDSTSAGAVRLTTGSAELKLTAGSGGAAPVLPGKTVTVNPGQADTITNTGTVPLQLSVQPSASPAGAFGDNLTLGVGVGASCAAVTTLWTGTIAGGASSTSVLQPGDTTKLCVEYELPLNAPAGTQSGANTTVTLTIKGKQVAP